MQTHVSSVTYMHYTDLHKLRNYKNGTLLRHFRSSLCLCKIAVPTKFSLSQQKMLAVYSAIHSSREALVCTWAGHGGAKAISGCNIVVSDTNLFTTLTL